MEELKKEIPNMPEDMRIMVEKEVIYQMGNVNSSVADATEMPDDMREMVENEVRNQLKK